MPLVLRLIVVALCLVFLILVARQIARERLLLRYSLTWIGLAIIIIFGALFPGPVYMLAHFCGFDTTSNFIFLVGLFFLLTITLSLSAIVSKQARKIKTLTQELALLKKEMIDSLKS
ncbi:MAG: DUF2304 domain-containing protein [Solibacillus sp.]